MCQLLPPQIHIPSRAWRGGTNLVGSLESLSFFSPPLWFYIPELVHRASLHFSTPDEQNVPDFCSDPPPPGAQGGAPCCTCWLPDSHRPWLWLSRWLLLPVHHSCLASHFHSSDHFLLAGNAPLLFGESPRAHDRLGCLHLYCSIMYVSCGLLLRLDRHPEGP